MCGIACVVTRYPSQTECHKEGLARILDHMKYRGPDGKGMWGASNVLLGHRRLSIIDLSEAGSQPFHDHNYGLHISFNGEIYNYRDLRLELEAAGYRFRSNTDTEVILTAYHFFGDAFLDRLRGMFAFALYDEKRQRVFLCRDRLGKKPLYYYFGEDRFMAFSELKFFHAFVDLPLTIDEESVQAFFALQFIPGPHTIYKEIKLVMPGEYMELNMASWGLSKRRYWNLCNCVKPDPSHPITEELIETRIAESVRFRLIADVEIGILLSGGIDSSLLACYVVEASEVPPRAFTVSFEQQGLDESEYSRIVARALGMELVVINGSNLNDAIFRKVIYHGDEPLADPALVPTFMISEQLAQYVKVVISGEGADELFWGYDRYRMEISFHHFRRLVRFLSFKGKYAGFFASLENYPKASSAFSRMCKILCSSWDIGIAEWTTNYGEPALGKLLTVDTTGRKEGPRFAQEMNALLQSFHQRMTSLESNFAIDLAFWLPDDLLAKVDRMTMAHSIEARAPYLDHVLVEAALSAPPEFKLDAHANKKVLRKLLHAKLPSDAANTIADRRKHGFDVPLAQWLSKDLLSTSEYAFSEKSISRSGYFNVPCVLNMWNGFKKYGGKLPFARKLWTILCFQTWLDHHENRFGF